MSANTFTSDPRALAALAAAGAVAGLGLGAALLTLQPAGTAPPGGPPSELRATVGAEAPSLRPRLAPDLRWLFALPRAHRDLAALHPARRELECLADAVYYEARGEPAAGQAAVAQVVLNRARRPGFPKSVCGVVFQRAGRACQFSFACDGSVTARRDIAAWGRARRVASLALAGRAVDEVGGATHFHTVTSSAAWGARFWQVARIGAHVFYGRGEARRPALAPAALMTEPPSPTAPPAS